jgi:hypothetical protein
MPAAIFLNAVSLLLCNFAHLGGRFLRHIIKPRTAGVFFLNMPCKQSVL